MTKYQVFSSLALFLIPIILFITNCDYCAILRDGKTTILRDDLQLVCRENDAIILASSYFVSTGQIYYLEKKNGSWGIAQTINLVPYLKGWFGDWHTMHLTDQHKSMDNYHNNSIVYNDHWLVVTIRKVSAGAPSNTIKDDRGRAIIFKKVDGVWEHYYTLRSSEYFVYASCVALTDFNQLIISDPFEKTSTTLGVVRCFDLKGKKPRLVQEIYPPKSNIVDYGFSWIPEGSFGEFFCTSDNRLIIQTEYQMDGVILNQYDQLLYRFTGDKWEYCCSLLDKVPREIYYAKDSAPLNNVVKVEFQNDGIIFQLRHRNRGALQFKQKNDVYTFEQSCFEEKEWTKEKILRRAQFLAVQTPESYSLVWLGKRDRFGLTKPSTDGVIRLAEPDWIVEDADPETNRLVTDYYQNDFNPSFSADAGCESFYEYTAYVPSVDYALSGTTLVTSYFFKDCYFTGNRMQKADVWGGVNIYEIDPETGPKKVFALTTRNLEDLKPVPVATEDEVSQ